MDARQALDKFVAEANIEGLRRRLVTEIDESKRSTMLRLLVDEEMKLAALITSGA